MKKFHSHEFFYYDSNLTKEYNDFTGDNTISPERRKDFLKQYAEFLERFYSLPKTPIEVVTEEDVSKQLAILNLDKEKPILSQNLNLNTMTAFLETKRECFQGWSLYTKKVTIENNTICFKSDSLPPTAAALYNWDNSKKIKRFEFSFFMSSEYNAEIQGGILDTTYGRTVEFRCGIEDIIKLQFYSNGQCYARLGDKCPYHLKNVFLSNFEFDKWQFVKIEFLDNTFKVELNGNTIENLNYSRALDPDTLFIGCGMFNVGDWKFCPERFIFEEDIQTEFFVQKRVENIVEECLGEIQLPYAVGGYKNRDKYLVLEKNFIVSGGNRVFVSIETIDPGGEIYVNGHLVVDTDGFESIYHEITGFIKEGENNLKIRVCPRAPEVLFNWHRQKDAYNGWFCGEVKIDVFNESCIKNIEVLPIMLSAKTVKCIINSDIDFAKRTKIYLRKIYPNRDEKETFIGEFSIQDNRLSVETEFEADAWSPETANLYAIRLVSINEKGVLIDDAVCETGFRIIEQQDGKILLNGVPIVLTGALTMQFLPPYNETPITHICPTTEQVLWQEMMCKKMNGNTLRMHVLGYGSNDSRFARIADRLGLMLIWTTRYIDSVEQMALQSHWAAKNGYIKQLKERINHPSIIMWEGTNEYHPSLNDIDRIFESFVPSVKCADPTRLICPISHLYYAGDAYPKPNCAFYNDAGTTDHNGNSVLATEYWSDEMVVRSAHTYDFLLGYGSPWKKMRTQDWSMQGELYNSKDHAYIVSEFAVIGRQNPNSPKAKQYFNSYSYEFPDEDVLGFRFKEDEWRESQAYQALAAKFDVKVMRLNDVDGMLWCCLMGGANDGGYLKPPIDCYGYPKFAFYTLRESYQSLYAADRSLDVLKHKDFEITPIIFGTTEDKYYNLKMVLYEKDNGGIDERFYTNICGEKDRTVLQSWKPQLDSTGYYYLHFEIEELL